MVSAGHATSIDYKPSQSGATLSSDVLDQGEVVERRGAPTKKRKKHSGLHPSKRRRVRAHRARDPSSNGIADTFHAEVELEPFSIERQECDGSDAGDKPGFTLSDIDSSVQYKDVKVIVYSGEEPAVAHGSR